MSHHAGFLSHFTRWCRSLTGRRSSPRVTHHRLLRVELLESRRMLAGDVTDQGSLGLTDVDFSSVAWGDYDNDGNLDVPPSGPAAASVQPVSRQNVGQHNPQPTQLDQVNADPFPFSIDGDRFLRNNEPVFLNILDYSPMEPGQNVSGEIHESRVLDDLRRLRDYAGGNDPIVLRVYPQPTAQFPVRMPKIFYDGVRELGFWIIRDIFFQHNDQVIVNGNVVTFFNPMKTGAIVQAKQDVDRVISEVEQVGAFDRIFAWEFGDEFEAPQGVSFDPDMLAGFLAQVRDHIKARMNEPGRTDFSDFVTWATFPPHDPLRTDGNPVLVDFDYFSINAYSYDPERIRDHQAGPVTGTPYAGYLAALKAALVQHFANKPMVVSETGLPDSFSTANQEQDRIPPNYPVYRKGGLTPEQVAEGLADRYWDARLSGAAAGFGLFEWNDEWWKALNPLSQDGPEEYFGIARFSESQTDELRFKLQQETIRDLYTLQFSSTTPGLGLTADSTTLTTTEITTIHATVGPSAVVPVRFRWETSRGYVTGDGQDVSFYAGGRSLGPAVVTAVAIDALGRASKASLTINITSGSPSIEILTFGDRRSSGRVSNVDLTQNKVVLYIHTNRYYVQPFLDMRSIWVGPDGYWWSPNTVDLAFSPTLCAWVVPNSFVPPAEMDSEPDGFLAETVPCSTANDLDNDLLPDSFEPNAAQDRYSDADGDKANNLEEYLAGTDPTDPDDNDNENGVGDGLKDNWERRYFGRLLYAGGDDPDGDGLTNDAELGLGIHPGRTAVDREPDGLPDTWELRIFGNLNHGPDEDPDGDGLTNLDVYELGVAAFDFGDAPDSYQTLFANNGARHLLISHPLFLGARTDPETNAQPMPGANGDDANGTDDEDGVTFSLGLVPGEIGNAYVVASGAGKLNAWIDFDNNGSWADAGDQIATDVTLAVGLNTVTFAVPLGATVNVATYARFRLNTVGGLSFTGAAADGEVEDYQVTILANQDDEIGVMRGNNFYQDVNGSGQWEPASDRLNTFGNATDTAIIGDWNGDEWDEIGVQRGNLYYLDRNGNGVWNGVAGGDSLYKFGNPGDKPLMGDWDGDGDDEIGVQRGNVFYLDRNGNGTWNGTAGGDLLYTFGNAGDTPLSGDWDGDGDDQIGIHRGSQFYLDRNGNGLWNGVAGGDRLFNFGAVGDVPLMGDWNADGTDEIGVHRGNIFYLDRNGNGVWNRSTGGDLQQAFGNPGDRPLDGKWSPVASLMAAGGTPSSFTNFAPLSHDALAPIVQHAIVLWTNTGLTASQLQSLSSVTFSIVDLPGAQLGHSLGGTILLDVNAAGYGWFVDPTPTDNDEFKPSSTQNSAFNVPHSMDLLSAVLHELGHELGFGHDSDFDAMFETLATGTRRLID